MTGLSILNVGDGDTKLTFDRESPVERERAARIVTDMLRRGYAILVQAGEKDGKAVYYRATEFDPDTCEYLIAGLADLPEGAPALADETVSAPMPPKKKGRGRGRRVSAEGASAVAVARSAGGMSDRADSIEMKNLEQWDSLAGLRNGLRQVAELREQWAGIPMPLEDLPLIVEPRYPFADAFKQAKLSQEDVEEQAYSSQRSVRNRFYSTHHRRDVVIWNEPDGRVEWGLQGGIHHFTMAMETMAASVVWGVEQEANAVRLLATLLPHHAFKKYLLTGMFVERSHRSGLFYFFRRLKPTVATSGSTGDMRILAVLCAHPIAYYRGTWAGAMCPTDDVIAALMMMRGDEAMYWRRCNQHRAYRPEAGL